MLFPLHGVCIKDLSFIFLIYLSFGGEYVNVVFGQCFTCKIVVRKTLISFIDLPRVIQPIDS